MSTQRIEQNPSDTNSHELENDRYFQRLQKCLRSLFEIAKSKNELGFAFSLSPEFRGMQGPGWNSAQETFVAFDQYVTFLKEKKDSPLTPRIALSFYCHLAESSGFYEIPKNLMRIAEGLNYSPWPFGNIVEKHKTTGEKIAPNANKVLKNLMGHAATIGQEELALCIRDAFDPDIRNAYAHADYVIWNDGIRLTMRNGGNPKIVSWPEFNAKLHRGANFFQLVRDLVTEYMSEYKKPRVVKAALNTGDPELWWKIHVDTERNTFSISTVPKPS